MLYVAIVFLAFLAAVDAPGATRTPMHARNPLIWLMVLGAVYWGLSLGNGNDWVGYFRESECLRVGGCTESYTSFEPLFAQLLQLSAYTDYQVVPLAAGLSACLAIVVMARSPHFGTHSILFFVSVSAYYLYVEQVRQGMALCLLILALDRYVSGRRLAFVALVAAACLLHWTSLLFVLPFWLARAGWMVRVLLAAVALVVFGVALTAPEAVFDVLVGLGLGELDFAKRIFFYAVIEDYNAAAIGLGFLFDAALMLLLLAPAARLRNAKVDLTAVVVAYFVILLLSRLNISLYRITLVFVPFVCMYLGNFFAQQRAGVVIGGMRFSLRLYGFLMALVMVAQSSRPLLDPMLRSDILWPQIYGIHGVPTTSKREAMAEAKCDFLEELGKGYLCGRW